MDGWALEVVFSLMRLLCVRGLVYFPQNSGGDPRLCGAVAVRGQFDWFPAELGTLQSSACLVRLLCVRMDG